MNFSSMGCEEHFYKLRAQSWMYNVLATVLGFSGGKRQRQSITSHCCPITTAAQGAFIVPVFVIRVSSSALQTIPALGLCVSTPLSFQAVVHTQATCHSAQQAHFDT